MYKGLNTLLVLILLGILSTLFAQERETENQSSSEVNPEVAGEGPCALGEVQVKLINAGTVLCVNKDTADSWIEGNFAVAFDGEYEQEPNEPEAEQKPREQKTEQPEAEQETKSESSNEVSSATVAENSCDPGQVLVRLIKAGTVRCVEKATAESWIEGDFAVAIDGEPEQETKQPEVEQKPQEQKTEQSKAEQEVRQPEVEQEAQRQESEQQEPEKEVESKSINEGSSVIAENSCDPGQVPVRLIQAGTVRCVEKATAELWIEGDFAVAVGGGFEEETEDELSNQAHSATTGENPCKPEEVQVKLINAGTVLCVDEDTAKSWIESDFAVKFN